MYLVSVRSLIFSSGKYALFFALLFGMMMACSVQIVCGCFYAHKHFLEGQAAVLEHLAAEVWNWLAKLLMTTRNPHCATPHSAAVQNDEELSKPLSGVTIAPGGVLPNIHSVFFAQEKKVATGLMSDRLSPFCLLPHK